MVPNHQSDMVSVRLLNTREGFLRGSFGECDQKKSTQNYEAFMGTFRNSGGKFTGLNLKAPYVCPIFTGFYRLVTVSAPWIVSGFRTLDSSVADEGILEDWVRFFAWKRP